jgi:hypothetical protein
MHAIIQQSPELAGAGLFPIAGGALIARQIQWLRTLGCGAIAVEIGTSPESGAIARWLSDQDALGAGVSLVLTGRPLAAREIAQRAGFPGDAPLLVVPANVIVGGALGACLLEGRARGARIRLAPPHGLAGELTGASLSLIAGGEGEPLLVEPFGWGVSLRSRADAMALEAAVLDGRLSPSPDDPAWGIQVHAAQLSPGIWVGRGALVERGAELVAPVLVGAGAVVCAGARVGPRVCLGRRAVVELGARLRDTVVSAGTIVGEGLELAHVIVEPGGFRDPVTGELRRVEDPLIVAERDVSPAAGLGTRAFALLLILPALLVRLLRGLTLACERGRSTIALRRAALGDGRSELAGRLFDALRGGTPALVGVSPWTGPWPDDVTAALYEDALSAPLGIFVVDAALAPPDADAATRLRARAWYAHAKTRRVDLRLVLAALRAARRGAGRRAVCAQVSTADL